MYVIDKQRVKNTFSLLLSNNMEGSNMKGEEFDDPKREIYAPSFWYFYDFIIVIAHLLFLILIGCPVVLLVIFVRMQ